MATAILEQTRERRLMVAAFAKTGAGSIASGLLSALAVKIVALSLGAPGVAALNTLQQVMQAGVTAATLNGQTAIVQGASAFEGRQRRDFLTTALWMVGIASLASVGVVWICGGSSRWIWVAVMMASGFTFASALLRARGEVGALAALQVMAAGVYALAAIAPAIKGGKLITMLTIPTAAALACALAMIARDRDEIAGWFGGRVTSTAASHFLKISGAMLATSLLATGVLLAVRGHITRESGLEATGTFDAAWNISMNHVTLILASMQIYYLPALARTRDATERSRQIRTVMEIAIAAGAAVICGIALLRPWVIALLYSRAFEPAADLLKWTLIGDYLKITSWVLAIPMLAAADLRWFAGTDCAVQIVFFVAAWMMGEARGASMGFAISYAVNFVLCAIYARRRHGFRFGARAAAMWIGGLALVVGACA